MTLYIKNMVCNRCIQAVRDSLEEAGLAVRHIQLGQAELTDTPGPEVLEQIRGRLKALGFELLDDARQQLISQIKSAIVRHVHEMDVLSPVNLSDYLPKILHREYTSLSRLFSETEGRTIEQFYIEQKIERAKEFLVYNELTLSEIAWKLGYSSVAHLSSQFKKVTGLTPSHFRQVGASRRRNLDAI